MKLKLLRLLIVGTKLVIYGITLQCLFLSLLLAKDGLAQDIKSVRKVHLEINLQNASLLEAFRMIEKRTDFQFAFDKIDLDRNIRINLPKRKGTVADILLEISRQANLKFRQVNNYINVHKVLEKDPVPVEVIIEEITIKGKVTSSEDGEALPGVNVIIKGTSQGTVTDLNGNYEIDVPDVNAILVFSSVGYTKEEVVVADRTSIDVSLNPDVKALQEIVVVGYGTQKKIDVTGSVETIAPKEFEKLNVTRTSQLLSGLASGVTVIQNSAQPGKDAASIRIRGLGTFSDAGNSPLVLVDGLSSSLDNVDVNDIASISVLKDAASASIYGTRGANGVILIETKKGHGDFRISYQGDVGLQRPAETPQIVDSWVYAEMYNEALTNSGGSPQYSAEEIAKFKSGEDPDNYPNKKHYDDLISSGSGLQTKHHISFQGGTDKNTYRFSFSYLNQNGLVAETNYRRYNVLLNVNSQIKDNLALNVKLAGISSKSNEPTAVDKNPPPGVEGLIDYAIKIPNTYAGKKSDGYYGNQTGFTVEGWMDSESFISNAGSDATASVNLDWTPVKSLKITGLAGYESGNNLYKLFRPSLVVDQFITAGPAELRERNTTNSLLTLQAYLNYDLAIGDHGVHFLAGYSQENYLNRWVEGYRDNFPNNALYELNAGSASNQQSSGSAYEWALRSFFGRVNYNFKERYMFEANARYDGSSRFPEDHRFGLFPSVSAGWRISEEDFFPKFWINELKLRGSWGKLGNQNIGNYPYQQTLTLGLNAPFGVAEKLYPGAAAQVVPNKDITWESTRVADVGLDLSLLEGKLDFSVDYFDKLTSGILYNITSSAVLGLTPSVQNAGVVSNKGIDLNIQHHNAFGEFNYTIGGNFSYVKNEVLDLANVERDINNGLFVGYPIESIYGYVDEGLFVDDADVNNSPDQPRTAHPGDIKFKDLSGPEGVPDGKVDADYDRKIIGNQFPKINFGINLSANYRGFDLSVQLRGVAGIQHIISGHVGNAFLQGSNPQEWMVKERWTTENPDPNAKYPRLQVLGGSEQQFWNSTYVLINAAYLRANNIQLGYTFSNTFMEKLKVSNFRVYANINNLFTLDHYRVGWDPEMQSYYPPVRVYTLGLSVTL